MTGGSRKQSYYSDGALRFLAVFSFVSQIYITVPFPLFGDFCSSFFKIVFNKASSKILAILRNPNIP